jgi:hypothetical protein
MKERGGFVIPLSYIHVMIKVMMNQEDIYQAEQELARYNAIMSFKEILNQEEYEFCKEWDPEEAFQYLNDVGNGRYLNINVYSEADKEEHDLRREMGI